MPLVYGSFTVEETAELEEFIIFLSEEPFNEFILSALLLTTVLFLEELYLEEIDFKEVLVFSVSLLFRLSAGFESVLLNCAELCSNGADV